MSLNKSSIERFADNVNTLFILVILFFSCFNIYQHDVCVNGKTENNKIIKISHIISVILFVVCVLFICIKIASKMNN